MVEVEQDGRKESRVRISTSQLTFRKILKEVRSKPQLIRRLLVSNRDHKEKGKQKNIILRSQIRIDRLLRNKRS